MCRPHQSLENFAQACRSIGEPIFGRPLNEISFARVLGQLFGIAEAFDMEVQPQLLLLQKNMLMAEGVSRRLNPDLNIWTLAQPLVEEWMRENRGPEARLERRPGRCACASSAGCPMWPTASSSWSPASAARACGSTRKAWPGRAGDRAGAPSGPCWIALAALAVLVLVKL